MPHEDITTWDTDSSALSRIFLGAIVTLMEPSFLSSRIGLTISATVLPLSDAKHCNRPRKRLQPPPQTFATVPANVCGKSLHLASVLASTCNRPCKYVRLRLFWTQCTASADAVH